MSKKIIITGGGTGGHIFPALSVAAKLSQIDPDIKFLFVGAQRGMEMTLVPKNGHKIVGLNITGIQRKINFANIIQNLIFPFRLLESILKARKIIRTFKPDIIIGFGGYASGPMGRAANSRGIPLIICEQNAFPGITNKWLAPMAEKILLGNEDALKYFPAEKTTVTGNPVRESLNKGDKEEGRKRFGLKSKPRMLLVLGGSLGAKSINSAMEKGIQKLLNKNIQVVWQCGERFYETVKVRIPQHPSLRMVAFIDNMADAYAAADLVVTRAGGSTISELIMLEKPSILVPSPNVAEDHQTKNALSLSEKGAAILIKDEDAMLTLVDESIRYLTDESLLNDLSFKVKGLPKHDSATEIADHILKTLGPDA